MEKKNINRQTHNTLKYQINKPLTTKNKLQKKK